MSKFDYKIDLVFTHMADRPIFNSATLKSPNNVKTYGQSMKGKTN